MDELAPVRAELVLMRERLEELQIQALVLLQETRALRLVAERVLDLLPKQHPQGSEPCQQQSTGRLQLPPQLPARPSGPDGSTVQR